MIRHSNIGTWAVVRGLAGVFLVVALVGVLICVERCTGGRADGVETRIEVRRDTVRDTLVVKDLVVDTAYVVRYETVSPRTAAEGMEEEASGDSSEILQDSAGLLHVPIVQKVYRDSDYTAYVSGWMPELDSLVVYPRTITNTVTQTMTVREKAGRWGVGVTGGVGYGMASGKADVFVGVGMYYRLWPR